MFWGGIMHGYSSTELPYHFFTSLIETPAQRAAATPFLNAKHAWNLEDWAYFTARGEPHTYSLVKTRDPKCQDGIDWFIYKERILCPKVLPFLYGQMKSRQKMLYFCEDNALSHAHYYNTAEISDNGFKKTVLPDINLIEQVWNYIKRRVKERIGWDFTDAKIRAIVVEEWLALPIDFINRLIASLPQRLAAIIAANGGNEFEA